MNYLSLDSQINKGSIKLGRGNVISSKDIKNIPGDFPIYSSSAKGNGEFGRYGKYMFDEELITWSVDGGGKFFLRCKHKFSVTNVSGYMLVDDAAWDIKYLYYMLDYQHQKMKFDYQMKAHPSVIRKLYYIWDIPRCEQSKIAKILETVERSIEHTEALIAKQERIKTGLMRDLLTKGIDEHGNIRSEDTHEFKESPLGRIPVEWDVKPLFEIADIDRGKFTHRPRNDPRFFDGEYPFIQTGDVTSNVGRVMTTYTQTLNENGIKVSKVFPAGTIAITIAANIADTAILGIPMYFPDSVVGAVVKEPNNIRFVELMIRKWKPVLKSLAPQSAQKNINLEVLRPLSIAVPHPLEQERIGKVYEKLDDDQRNQEMYLLKLSEIKRALMQDLLTGKKRVTPLLEETEVIN